jgi:sporulation protein YlmC with PRC-barrel domain
MNRIEMLQRRDEMTLELSSSERKDIISHDGRKIGVLVGVNIDTKTWTVHAIVVEVNKDIIEELHVKKSMLKLPRINLKTDLVGVVGDIVHLNVDLKNLKDYI